MMLRFLSAKNGVTLAVSVRINTGEKPSASAPR